MADVRFDALVTRDVTPADFDAGIVEILLEPVLARIDAGVLVSEDGTPGVRLISGAEVDIVGGLRYRATFYNASAELSPLIFNALDEDETFDLQDAAPVVLGEGRPTARGPRGYTPWFVQVSSDPPLYQAFDPTGAIGEPFAFASTSGLNTVNVMAFGAVGDGVASDSLAIKSAQAALTDNSVLYFPAGTYRFSQRNPAGAAAITLAGLSNVGVFFEPGATLLMDNLDDDGMGTSNGILVTGRCSNVTLVNPTVTWKTIPSARGGHANGIMVLGWPGDANPDAGWLGSTGKVEHINVVNPNVSRSPEAGIIFIGASDVSVLGSTVYDTLADALHFNACRRVTVNGHKAINNGDDGLAFVNYYHATQKWDDAHIGPFWLSELSEWCSSGSASAVTVDGNRANGFRVQMARDLTISDVQVTDKDFGFTLNSAVIGPGNDWASLASRNVTINNIAVADCGSGVVLATNLIDKDDDEQWWNFDGCIVSNITIRNSGNWSFVVEQPDNDKSILSGVNISNIVAIAGDDTPGEEVGGHGGIRFTGLSNSQITGAKLISDHGSADIVISGSAQRYGFSDGEQVTLISVEDYPLSNLSLDGLTVQGGGRVLIQDIAGLAIGRINSNECTGIACVISRVLDLNIASLAVRNPGRTEDLGRGFQVSQSYNVDIGEAILDTDDHEGASLWQALEIGGGTADHPGGSGIRVEKLVYTSEFDKTASEVVVQTGDNAPVDWYVNVSWLHKGADTPTWRHRRYGTVFSDDLDPAQWFNGPIDLDSFTKGGVYWVAGAFLDGAANPTYHTPGNTGLIKLTVTVADPDDAIDPPLNVFQEYVSLNNADNGGQRFWTEADGWSDWWIYPFSIDGIIPDGTLPKAKLTAGVQASLDLADSSLQPGSLHSATGKTTPVNADELLIADSAASFGLKKLTWANLKAAITSITGNAGTATALATARSIDGQSFDGTANITVVAPGTHAASGKTTPVDADEIPIVDTAASNVLKKLTWANLKAGITSVTGNAGTATALETARNIDGQSFNGTANITVIAPGTHAATGKTIPVDADELPLVDSAASNVLKKLTWANLKAAVLGSVVQDLTWIEGPVDLDDLTTPGVFVVGGSFLNGDPTTYNQPGNTGNIKLTVSTLTTASGLSPVNVVIQEYISIDGANHGGQRRRWEGSWNGWLAY